MTEQDTTTVFHYGLLLKERRKTRALSIPQLAKLSGVPTKRLAQIESDGIASNREKERIDKALHRYSYIAVVETSTEAINEQIDIIDLLQDSLLRRIKPRINIECYSEVETLVTDIVIETAYYGLLISRAGFEERILEKVRQRRKP